MGGGMQGMPRSTPAAAESVAEAHEPVQNMNLEESSSEAKSFTHENEQPAPLQSAETILRALGIPLTAPHTVRSPELSGSKGISGITRNITPFPHTQVRTTRFRSFVRSRSKNGVTLEMAV